MKWKLITVFLFALFCNTLSFSQSKETSFLIDTSIVLMKKHALNSSSVNWREVEEQVHQKVKGINSDEDLKNAIVFLFRLVGDHHGWLQYKDKQFGWEADWPAADDSLEKEFNKGVKIKTQLLNNNIGYLRMPPMDYKNRDKEVRDLNDSLCYLLNNKIKGLIIDLRLNGGGDTHPMALGLLQVLGEGKISTMVNDKDSSEVVLRNHAIYHDNNLILSLKPSCNIDATKLPVVLLTSGETASSGEGMVINFKGRPNTVTLGVPTAGFVTGNVRIRINQDATIFVANFYNKDRTGKTYKTTLQPDIYIDAVNKMNDVPHDLKVIRAVSWLTAHLH